MCNCMQLMALPKSETKPIVFHVMAKLPKTFNDLYEKYRDHLLMCAGLQESDVFGREVQHSVK